MKIGGPLVMFNVKIFLQNYSVNWLFVFQRSVQITLCVYPRGLVLRNMFNASKTINEPEVVTNWLTKSK